MLSSVKADLLAATCGWRSQVGSVRIYDPTASTVARDGSAIWSPLGQASTILGAQRAARALCDSAPRNGVDGGMDFWLAQAEILLSGLMYVAHHVNRDMEAVCEWVLCQDHPTEHGPGEVRAALDSLMRGEDRARVDEAAEASKGLVSVWELDERTRSSVYSTAQTVVWPWSEPGVAASARAAKGDDTPPPLDLSWLLSGSNTVYLCAPIEDQRRLAPAFGGLLNDLINQAYRQVASTGRPLDPPLLVVIDEAGNTPLRSLPEYASTLAGIGVVLVTIWQSLAQMEASYGRQADTILTNHLTKCFFAGLSDPASLRYVDQVLGDAEVDTRSRSADGNAGRRSDQYSTTRVSLAPAHTLRQMRPGDALLVHGTLPPAHVRTRPFYKDRTLARRARLAPAPSQSDGDALHAPDRPGTSGPGRRVAEPAGQWAGKEVDVVFDCRSVTTRCGVPAHRIERRPGAEGEGRIKASRSAAAELAESRSGSLPDGSVDARQRAGALEAWPPLPPSISRHRIGRLPRLLGLP